MNRIIGWGPEGVISRREFTRWVALGSVVAAFPACGGEEHADPDDAEARVAPLRGDGRPTLLDNVRVPMRDGVALATDVWIPSRGGRPLDGPFPVVLERTPYGRKLPSRSERSRAAPDRAESRAEVAARFTARGFVVVYQDCRGRYDSEGEYEKYVDDAEDGFDCCAWIVEQPWCDGRIGTKGLSYAAHTQAALASLGAPGLASMFLDSGGFANAYQGGIRQGGAFELKQATWAHRNALVAPEVLADPEAKAALEAVDLHAWFARMPWAPGDSPVAAAPDYEAYLFEQWRAGTFDDYWKVPGLWAEGYHDVWPDVPMVHMSSWYDPYPRTAVDNYRGLRAAGKRDVRLILGPWTHGDRSLTWAGEVDFGADAVIDGQGAPDFWELRLRWFEHTLHGLTNDVASGPRVRYFVMGGGPGDRDAQGRLRHGGRWRTAADWPVPGTETRRLHLRAEGALTESAPDAAAELAWTHDPRDPVPTIGGAITSGRPIMEGGAYDQVEGPEFFGSSVMGRPLSDRPDVLAFRSPPLESAVEVTGPIEVELWVASDAPDTDLTIKLVDEYPPSEALPDGFAMILTDGILRLRYRDSFERPSLLEPGRVYRVQVTAFPTSNLFAAGHRIRLDIASSNFPKYDLNFGTGEPEGSATEVRTARNTLHLSPERPSALLLPVVPG